jgi:type II secretory pathway component PulF
MTEITLIAVGPFVLMIAGTVLLWWMAYPPGAVSRRRNVGAIIGSVIGWMLLLLGAFLAVGLATHALAIVAIPATAIIVIMAIRRFQAAERMSLLRVLAAAAERDIPLESAARAFAADRRDFLGLRAQTLADYLEAGVPLTLAFRRSYNSVPPSVELAADLGQQMGTLGSALRQAIDQLDDLEVSLRSLIEKLFYLTFIVTFGIGVLTFILIKIVPVFQKILEEFDVNVPAVTRGVVDVSHVVVSGGWVLLLPLIAILGVLMFAGLLYYVGISPRFIPGRSLIWWRADTALVLRWIATAVRQKRPIAEAVRLLAIYFPYHRLRYRLAVASKRIDQGADWTVCLRHARVIRLPEGVVFKAAERVGNLAWALDEMADSCVRRSAYRLRLFVSVAFPTVLIVVGVCFFFVQVGILMPLIKLIQWVS